ncbi:MAG: iron ABC transporter permease [Cyclobacteriaceae bacterium]|nr:iron ABC transporter permease [Cyclobacteriaceae bacterium]MCH8515897.1 iron ABC transporter permease [Cyclobacteriaceae bacterium]
MKVANQQKTHLIKDLSIGYKAGIFGGLLLFLVILASQMGVLQVSFEEMGLAMSKSIGWHSEELTARERAWLNIRLPRIALALLVGTALACSGAGMQAIFRNPLVEPGLVGVSAGAALFAAVALVFLQEMSLFNDHFINYYILPVAAFLGGLLATWLIYKLGKGQSIALFILAGVAVNAACGALIGLVVFHADDTALRSFTFWNLGDLSGASWGALTLITPLILISAGYLYRQHRAYDALAMGDRQAFHLGVDVEKVRKRSIFFVALAVGSAVAIAGAIGFIGLVVPHLVRLVFGPSHRYLILFSALLGSSLLLLADTYSRTAVQPGELPVGIVTAMLGAPFFIYLIKRMKSKAFL